MRAIVTEEGVLIPKELLQGMKEVEMRREDDRIIVEPTGRRTKHLAEVQGWVEEDDAFFQVVEQIVEERDRHLPRALKELTEE